MKDNKLIAEFMSIKYDAADETFHTNEGWKGVDYLMYHASWDWLMPVVHKIRVPYNNTEVTGERCEDIISVLAEGCVEANIIQVYEAVVEFIKQH